MRQETNFQTVFILYSEEDGDHTPVAAFSDRDTADQLASKLNRFIEGGVAIKEIPKEKCLIEVDKYRVKVKWDFIPYNISLDPDGNLFEHWDVLDTTLDEPTLEDQVNHVSAMRQEEALNRDKVWGFGGTYWAHDSAGAIEEAKSQLDQVIKHLRSTKA